MSQINSAKFQMLTISGMNNTTWTALTIPTTMPWCHSVFIANVDAALSISICTDPSDANPDACTAGQVYNLTLPPGTKSNYAWQAGEAVCWLKGAGAQPRVFFYI